MSETLNILMELLNEYRESECALDEDRVTYYANRLDGRTVNERWMNSERTEDERMSITEELRDWSMDAFAAWIISRVELDALHAIADRIDVEYAAYRAAVDGMLKEYVKLPVDADGVPIHVGDELTDGKVARLLICDDAEENSVYVYETPHIIKQINCCEVVHRKPDSWESIIEDALTVGWSGGWQEAVSADVHDKLVERCRRLAGDAE